MTAQLSTGERDLSPVLVEVWEERDRQDARWGEQSHDDDTGPDRRIVSTSGPDNAELADRARARCDRMHRKGEGTWEQILTEEVLEAYATDSEERLRAELVQVAAVAVAWIEAIDRREARP